MRPVTQAGIVEGAQTITMQEGNSRGILLLHGFGDTPQTLKLLAHEISVSGYDVRAPLLPGHGRNVQAFLASRRSDWLNFARKEFAAMRQRYDSVAVIGLSMGGALAAILAAENPDTPALVMLAPYLDMPFNHKVASATFWLWAGGRPHKSNSPGSIRDPIERERNLGYGVYGGRVLYELWRLTAMARESLAKIISPTLIIQSRADPRIAPEVAERALASLGSAVKKLVWAEGTGHIITVDYGRELVFREVCAWLAARMPRS